MVQPFLLSTDADCLILLDCCYAAKGAKDSGTILRGTNEVIAACSPESRTTGVERRSFTSVLMRQLEEFAHAFRKCGQKFTAVGLHSALFRFSRELQYGPFYVRLTNSEYSSIDLTPLPKATVSADDDSGINMGLSTEGSPGSESSSLNCNPKAVARVLVAIHLTKSPRGDLVGFLRGEGLIPSYVNAMEVLAVEAVFESNSVLAIISMPIGIWDLLPEETPCSYIGITYSKNLLDSSIPPQLLSGLGPAKGEDKSVPTHYHSSSEEKMRETVLGKKRPDTVGSTHNLATVLSKKGKYEQAEEMHRQVLGSSETVLGKEHPNILTSTNNLATLQSDQSECEQADDGKSILRRERRPKASGTFGARATESSEVNKQFPPKQYSEVWYCHLSCQFPGPWRSQIRYCFGCQHERCGQCEKEIVVTGDPSVLKG